MRKATGRVTGKYNYNYLCPRCGRVIKWSEARRMWYGVWVCKEDWEYRHPMELYRTRPDAHKLDQTSADTTEITWVPTLVNVTVVNNVGTSKLNSSYQSNVDINNNKKLTFFVQYDLTPNATLAIASAATLSLPVTAVSAGTYNVSLSNGQVLSKGSIAAMATTINLPVLLAQGQYNLKITGTYGV